MNCNVEQNNIQHGTRRTKNQLYHDQQNEILKNMLQYVKLDTDGGILSCDLKNNIELKKYIFDSINNIKKYYAVSSWGYFIAIQKGTPTSEITLLRSLLKEHGYNILTKNVTSFIDGKRKKLAKIYFVKPTHILYD